MTNRLILPLLTLSIVMLFTGGCASAGSREVNIPVWQHNVENYVHTQGNGDPTVLRDMTIADGRKGYAMLGNPILTDSTDAVGLLLGVPRIANKPAFAYLVGLVQKGKTTDLHLAILTFDGNHPRWSVGPSDVRSLQTYMKYRIDKWKLQSPQHPDVPLLVQNFPAADDVFTLNVTGDRASATHQATGAVWTARVPASAPKP